MESPSVRAAPATVSGAAPASAEAEEDSEAPKMRRKVFMACNASSTCALSNTTGPCNTPIYVQIKTSDTNYIYLLLISPCLPPWKQTFELTC